MMNKYELTLILSVVLDTAGRKKLMEKLEKAVTDLKGHVENKEEWGKKSLAYTLKKSNEGYYFIYKVSLDGKGAKDLNDKLRNEENVLRSLLIKV
ncbi:MAG: 30S ribosomal protein S6 [Candidatus Gottesmanbacteria bacterium GW2011_GWC2_39_8]|uniref:Small ribosomal subunit protein bS6 n=1 Tax=Candidatus Gottesmanbacteria bacterium GW2011_GWC2_39_8 TaxID=1618450 RepID=A0A0G0PVC9_9BACT|nr:MAG: 30S ribosomal protein S6 [Candidatus Gottesmanbacteria bacterium GW2011_GWC2_39_8]